MKTNKEIDRIIKRFDKQIEREYEECDENEKKCPSYWHKLLFINTLDFTINDWNKLRDKDYWETNDNLKGIEQSVFILKRVRRYRKQYKNKLT
jgi:hypothetical protein